MSFLVGLQLGRYVMLGADTQITGAEVTYAPKLFRIRTGLVGGVGLSDLVDALVGRLVATHAVNLSRITDIIHEERSRYSGPTHLPDGTDVLEHTAWILTTEFRERASIAAYYFTSENGYEALPIAEGQALPIMPMDAPGGAWRQVADRINDSIRPPKADDDIDENILYHTQLVGQVIANVAQYSGTVSVAFQVGIHIRGGTVRLSEMLEDVRAALVFQ